MKRILLILSFILLFVLYGTRANSCAVNTIDNITKIENVSKINLCLPCYIKIYPCSDSNFVKIQTEDSILRKNIIYEYNNSILNFRLKNGTYKDWGINENTIKFFVGVKSNDPAITTSNDLILSNVKKDKKSKSNHETENN